MSRKTWISLGVIVALMTGGGAYYVLNDCSKMKTVHIQPTSSGPIYEPLATDHTSGNPKANVVLIEYASPTCTLCANFMINFYPKLEKDYIDTGKIFYVYRIFLRGTDDAVAEKLARCLPKRDYMYFNDALFRFQPRWDHEFGIPSPDGVHAALMQMAGEWGLSAAYAWACIANTADEAALKRVGEDGVAKYAINTTPTFVINGHAQPGFDGIFSRLDSALAGK